MPKGRLAGLRYLNAFVEHVKSCDRFTVAIHGSFEIVAGVVRPTSLH